MPKAKPKQKAKRRPQGTSAPAKRAEASRPAPPPSRRLRLVGIVAGLAGAVALVAYVAHGHGAAPAGPADAGAVSSPVETAPVPPPIDAAPAAPRQAFIGSEKCGDCHDKELQGWQRSWHARALSPGTPKFVVGNFRNAHFAGTSNEAWMRRAGDVSTMRTRGPDGELADFKVDYVIGGKRMQDAVTVFPDGRWQVLPIYFHVADKSWVDYTETKQGALAPDHPFYWTNARRMANHECLDCHTTGLRVTYDTATATWTTAFADGSVACESCHGAGSRHAETSEPRDVTHPVKARKVGVAACARCHGPRQPLFPLLDADDQFHVGDDYDELYDPIVMTLPDGSDSSDFFVDGKPKTSSFEYQAMLQSQCYLKGGADCLTCHTAPHDAAHRKADLRATPDELCGKCHAPERAAGTAHSHHKAASCIACHMPPIVSGVLDHFADHTIDVPAPANTRTHGVPSACGTCHPNKSADELAASLAAWWPDAGARQERRIRLADAFDPATAKDSLRPLFDVLADTTEAPTLRGAAAVVLGRRAGPRAGRVLASLLADPSTLLRAKAAEALGAARATTAADALAAHVGDPSLRVRLAVALALHDLHDARGDAALRALADDPASSHLMIPHSELATAAMARKDWPTAKRELEWVTTLSPYFVDALVQLAYVDRELGDPAAARRRLDQALQLEPKNRGALALRAQLP